MFNAPSPHPTIKTCSAKRAAKTGHFWPVPSGNRIVTTSASAWRHGKSPSWGWKKSGEKNTWDGAKTLYLNGKNYQPQLVIAGVLKHQQWWKRGFGKGWCIWGQVLGSLLWRDFRYRSRSNYIASLLALKPSFSSVSMCGLCLPTTLRNFGGY